jgi:adhesin transport system outer membrane protein
VQGLGRIMSDHPLMQSVNNDVASAREQIGVDYSSFMPRVGVRANAGKQRVDRDRTLDSAGTMQKNYDPREVGLTVTQLLWDFGATSAAVTRAKVNYTKEEKERDTQRINLLLAGIEAHLKLLKARQQLEYANRSVENIKLQTQLESNRIEAGKGLTTDLLQARAQLAGAHARRVSAQSAVDTAVNRYRAVFGVVNVPATLEAVLEPQTVLPPSLEQALHQVERQNPDIIAARSRAALKDAERDAIRTKEYMPRIELVGDVSKRGDSDGTAGSRNDMKVLVQASWSFDAGLKADYATSAASLAAASERNKAFYVGRQAIEEAENAWTDLKAARDRQAHLNDQAEISGHFLELARKERELGRRSLLDVLSGETNLINALSDASAAETDVVLASFRMLRAIGALDAGQVVVAAPKPIVPLAQYVPAYKRKAAMSGGNAVSVELAGPAR